MIPKLNSQVAIGLKGNPPNYRKLKAQVAVEFFMYSGVFLFVLLAALAMIQVLQTSEIPAQESRLAKEQGQLIADSLSLSVVAGQGFSYNLILPKKMLGRPYEVAFNSSPPVMVLSWNTSIGEVNYLYSLPTYDYLFEDCLEDSTGTYSGLLRSDQCSNILDITNDGSKLVVRQET